MKKKMASKKKLGDEIVRPLGFRFFFVEVFEDHKLSFLDKKHAIIRASHVPPGTTVIILSKCLGILNCWRRSGRWRFLWQNGGGFGLTDAIYYPSWKRLKEENMNAVCQVSVRWLWASDIDLTWFLARWAGT